MLTPVNNFETQVAIFNDFRHFSRQVVWQCTCLGIVLQQSRSYKQAIKRLTSSHDCDICLQIRHSDLLGRVSPVCAAKLLSVADRQTKQTASSGLPSSQHSLGSSL